MCNMLIDASCVICYYNHRKEVNDMSKKKRRKRKPTARPKWMEVVATDILAGTISGLITAAILKLLNW